MSSSDETKSHRKSHMTIFPVILSIMIAIIHGILALLSAFVFDASLPTLCVELSLFVITRQSLSIEASGLVFASITMLILLSILCLFSCVCSKTAARVLSVLFFLLICAGWFGLFLIRGRAQYVWTENPNGSAPFEVSYVTRAHLASRVPYSGVIIMAGEQRSDINWQDVFDNDMNIDVVTSGVVTLITPKGKTAASSTPPTSFEDYIRMEKPFSVSVPRAPVDSTKLAKECLEYITAKKRLTNSYRRVLVFNFSGVQNFTDEFKAPETRKKWGMTTVTSSSKHTAAGTGAQHLPAAVLGVNNPIASPASN